MTRRSLRGSLVALSIVACNAIVGIDDPVVVDANACVLNSNCADKTQVCLFRVCSPPCDADRDCAAGSRCLVTESGTACVAVPNARCSKPSDCPSGSVCSNGACRNDCGDGCLADQTCVASVCRGTNAHEEPVANTAGAGGGGGSLGSGGRGTSGGSSNAGSANSGGSFNPQGGAFTAGAENGAGAGGVDAGGSPSGGAPTGGAPGALCVPGTKQCADRVIQTCIDDEWTPTGECPFSCMSGECVGECSANSKDCKDLVPRSCSNALKWVEGSACAKVCEGGVCVDRCTAGTTQCSNGDLMRCDANGAWVLQQDCAVDCVNGRCTECTPPADQCVAGVHKTCGQDGTWGTGFTCPYMCVGNDCGVCTPNAQPSECIDNAPQFCDTTGHWKPFSTACSGSTPLCLNGKCVACTPRSNDCLDANTPRSCSDAGAWQNGADCAGSTPACLNGTCVACSPSSADCGDATTPRTCTSAGKWQNGAACSGATPACLNGACVACSPNSKDCLDSNTPRVCSAAGNWQNATDCSGSAPVCLKGACVACTPNPTPTSCTSTCSRTPRHCDANGAWANDTNCAAGSYCESGSCTSSEEKLGATTPSGASLGGAGNIVFAQRVEVTCPTQVMRLGAYFVTGGGQVQFGLYDGSATAPANLLAVSSKVNVQSGTTEASLSSSITLQPGTSYWVAANLSATGGWQINYEPTGNARYVSYDFASHSPALPLAFGATPSTYSNSFDFYAAVVKNP